MKYQIYIKKEIKSEADLPKEEGRYIVKHKTDVDNLNIAIYDETVEYLYGNGYWLNLIDWYLQPIELDLPDDINTTHETFKQWLSIEDKRGDTDYLKGFEDGLNVIAKIKNQLK